jgi:hypothetical protein
VNPHKTAWSSLQVWAYERAAVFAFAGERRLAMLRMWRAGQRLPMVFFTGAAAGMIDRATVDWTGFPDGEGPGGFPPA